MAAGLQVFGADGAVVLDTNDRIGKVLGTLSVSANGSISVPQLIGNQPFFLVYAKNSSVTNVTQSEPNVTVSGMTISWTYPKGVVPVEIVYGVY